MFVFCLTFNTCVFSQEIQKYSKTVNETKQNSFFLESACCSDAYCPQYLGLLYPPPTDEMDMSFFI